MNFDVRILEIQIAILKATAGVRLGERMRERDAALNMLSILKRDISRGWFARLVRWGR